MLRSYCLFSLLVVAPLWHGCYSPTLAEGVPCSVDGECPDGQGCDLVSLVCSKDPREACVEPLEACAGNCVDTDTDAEHCGDCDSPCEYDQVCNGGVCSDVCDEGLSLCGTDCVDLLSDDDHCNACDEACATDRECRGGSCELRCETFLNAPIQDSWGAFWDGTVRTVSAYADAESSCASFGGRLPTATELYRVSVAGTSEIGDAVGTPEEIWSVVPFDTALQVTATLSDGVLLSEDKTGSLEYRCICPEKQPLSFSGSACHGTPGSECFTLGRDGGNTRIDSQDRPPLRKSSALWECQLDGGTLATYGQLIVGIKSGMPGTGEWVHTADDVRSTDGGLLKWSGDPAVWTVSGNLSYTATNVARAFRCAGTSVRGAFGTGAEAAFAGTRLRADNTDTTAGDWVAAHDTCFAQGGHVPRAAELIELLFEGLPNGTNNWLFTSDEGGYNTVNFLANAVRWLAINDRPDYYSTTKGWVYRTGSYASRCVYYPIDANYTGPAAANCEGGCVEVDVPGGGTIWLDAADRAAAALETAYLTCEQSGGRMASKRDLHEAIRLGVLDGSGSNLWTDETGRGNNTTPRQIVVKWTGLDTAFNGQWTTYSTWDTIDQQNPYRCSWTNELR